MSDDWLAQLRQLHQDDKDRLDAAATAQLQVAEQEKAEQNAVLALLRDSHAHELLRQVQKALLDGQGTLTVYEKARKFDRAIVLAWQGPISDARRPHPNSSEPIYFIMVGVQQGKLWVNQQPLDVPTPNALKAALLAAGKNPARQDPKKTKAITRLQ